MQEPWVSSNVSKKQQQIKHEPKQRKALAVLLAGD